MKKAIKIIFISLLVLIIIIVVIIVVGLFAYVTQSIRDDMATENEPNFITLTTTADELDNIVLTTNMEMPDSIRRNLEDYDYLVSFVEMNYAPFSAIMEKGYEQEYRAMRKQLRQQISQGEVGIEKAASDYALWFCSQFDTHFRVSTKTFREAIKTDFPQDTEIIEYAPKAVSCKVDSCTWLIRVPSCLQSFEKQTDDAFQQFLDSDCENLIIDIRGNEGGDDRVWKNYYLALYDHPGKPSRIWFRNTPENIQFYEYVLEMYPKSAFVQKLLIRMYVKELKKLEKEFIKRAEKEGDLGFQPTMRIHRAAVLIDGWTASSAESLVEFVKNYSDRAKVYGVGKTAGANQTGDVNLGSLPKSKIEFQYPTTVESYFYDHDFSGTPGIAPDIIIPLPYATTLTDNIDEWVLWVAEDLKR
jgi:hypothetical protein